jgi:phenylalanyl-tRNA synthetase beta subunit
VVQALLKAAGISNGRFETETRHRFQSSLILKLQGEEAVVVGQVAPDQCKAFDLKQPVYVADFLWTW